jgi:hypothetical protein
MLGGLKRHIKGFVLLNNAFVLSNNAFDLTNIGVVLTLPQAFLSFIPCLFTLYPKPFSPLVRASKPFRTA